MFNQEEMERYLEEQKKKVEVMLAAVTPEERAQAEQKFAAMKAADDAMMQQTMNDAQKAMKMNTGSGYAPEAEKQVCFCPNCGAPAGGRNFCEYCGSSLKK